MIDDFPEPLTPADCDLRGLEWMPFHGDRLLNSDAWLMAGAEARCAMLMLLWAAWKQRPAASLPDQDRVLAQLAGYGLVPEAWSKIKREAMGGFILCNDGRFYHADLAESARDAWDRRVRERDRKATWRSKRDRTELGPTTGQDGDRTGTAASRPRPVPAERKGKERTGQEKVQASPPSPPRHPAFALDGVVPAGDREEEQHRGRPLCNGVYVDAVFDASTELAGIDTAKSTLGWAPLVAWLRDGIDPDTIYAAISRCADRQGYQPPKSLKYFDKAVREQKAAL